MNNMNLYYIKREHRCNHSKYVCCPVPSRSDTVCACDEWRCVINEELNSSYVLWNVIWSRAESYMK